MRLPRILLSAPASGSGKTMLTCGILQVLKNRGLRPVSFKCGPDYIDPMFHRTVLGTPSRNLDTYFTNAQTTRYLMQRAAASEQADIAVIEGVMGYYDGLAGISDKASAYDAACTVQAPTVLIVNCKGMSLSLSALVKGFTEFRKDSRIRGVILNRMSGMLYPRIKQQIEDDCGIQVLGYVPESGLLRLESRHLGLVMPEEVPNLQRQVEALAAELEKTLDVEGLLALAKDAPDMERERFTLPPSPGRAVVAVARDEAFCFYYEDNLTMLQELGAELRYFSPIHDHVLPPCDGLLMGGGYPELHVKELSDNVSMRDSVKKAVKDGVPTMAECGGFMYLLEEMEDMEGVSRPAAGVLQGRAYRTDRLGRFGYVELVSGRDCLAGPAGIRICGHEFHYYDTTNNGSAFRAAKPLSGRAWECMHASETLLAGYPHLYYYANPEIAVNFLKACCRRAAAGKGNEI